MKRGLEKLKRLNVKEILISVIIILSTFACSGNEDKSEKILARIGDKSISLNEFIRRAEYTIRPNYCRNNTNVDKMIILNSLIAEKLFALEAGSKNEFLEKNHVKHYLQGRKEQAMRQLLYKNEVTDKVKLDEELIATTSKYASREYDISYVSLTDTTVANQLKEEFFNLKIDWERNLKENYNLENIPSKKVIWSNAENSKVLDLLFTQNIEKGSILGPIKFSDEHIMFLKINGWNENKAVTEAQANEQIKNIRDVYTQRQARGIYENYIRNVMKNENINFNEKTFFALADIMGPLYMKTKEEREEIYKKGLWVYDEELQRFSELRPKLDQIKDKTLYTLSGEEFTVASLLQEIKIHPLVFREKTFPQKDFGFQLQMAILDMVRDRHLTREAYNKNIDKSPEVVRNENMWSDNLNAVNYKFNYLKESNSDSLYFADNQIILNNLLNPLVDSLQKKYSTKIIIDTELFNSIKLSTIDMAVNFVNAPFSTVVPSFPLVTTDHKLDYGKSGKNL